MWLLSVEPTLRPRVPDDLQTTRAIAQTSVPWPPDSPQQVVVSLALAS